MRERRLQGRCIGRQIGITPARAGKTRNTTRQSARAKDHPRSCGKDFCMCSASILNTGSPPLVRERLLVFGACAAMHRDHPRSCGKDASKRLTEASAAGSPPLVRERLVFDRFHVDVYGITPARAGKTNIYHIRGDTDRDHPRSCGKDSILFSFCSLVAGSPPLVRERPSLR